MLGPIALANNGDGNNLAAHPFDNDNVDDSFYIDNSVKYVSPTFHGLTGEALYGFSNAAGGFSDNRAYSFGLTYSIGPINLAAAYLQLNSGSLNGTGAVSNNDFVNFPAARQRVWAWAATTRSARPSIGLLWTHTLFDNTQPGANSVIAAAVRHAALRQLRSQRALCADPGDFAGRCVHFHARRV